MRYKRKDTIVDAYQVDKATIIHTNEGTIVASSGDYIITSNKGDKYVISEDRLNIEYEKVGEYLDNELS